MTRMTKLWLYPGSVCDFTEVASADMAAHLLPRPLSSSLNCGLLLCSYVYCHTAGQAGFHFCIIALAFLSDITD